MSKNSYKIFVVDDDEEDIVFLSEAFLASNSNAQIKSFLGGTELIKYLESKELEKDELPRYIIVDLNMPIINGLDTVQYLRKRTLFKEIPIIMLSTSSLNHNVEEAYRVGVDSYIEKPTSFSKLIKVVAHIDSWTNSKKV